MNIVGNSSCAAIKTMGVLCKNTQEASQLIFNYTIYDKENDP